MTAKTLINPSDRPVLVTLSTGQTVTMGPMSLFRIAEGEVVRVEAVPEESPSLSEAA